MDIQLNKEQKEAAFHKDGPCMVLAGPGSGKTFTIINRIRTLIEIHRVPPSKILVITFTRYAVQEMRSRFIRLFQGNNPGVTFGTFHGIYYGILKAVYQLDAGCLLSEEEQKELLKGAVLEVNPKERKDSEEEYLRELLLGIGKVKNGGCKLADQSEEWRAVYRAYEQRKKALRKIDFDDMLTLCYRLFLEHPDILKQWQDRYPYILVDEFQDSSRIQYEILKLLAASSGNVFVVGDDDQSIYGFRGARPEILQRFEEDYPGLKKVTLATNYRCSKHIVDAAARVIEQNQNRYKKNIVSGRERGTSVHIQEVRNAREEGDYVADEIRKRIQRGIAPNEIAVIFRTNREAGDFAQLFMDRGIPFFMRELVWNIYEHFIAQDMSAYFRMALGSRARKDLLQIMNRPNRYIGRDAIEKEYTSMEDIRSFYCTMDWMMRRVDEWEVDLQTISHMTPYAAMMYLRKKTGYQDFLKEYAKQKKVDFTELAEILDTLTEEAKRYRTLEEWLRHAEEYTTALETQKSQTRRQTADPNAVIFLTMHGAKGLEYDTVFVVRANEGVCPHKLSVRDDEIEEERRLFYVAMTRAKNKLTISYVKEKNGKEQRPSRFAEEVLTLPPHPTAH